LKKKSRPIRAIIENVRQLSEEQIASSEILKNLLMEEIPKAIELAYSNKKIYASIFEINATEEFVEIHKRDWEKALEKCVSHYISKEDYETCTRIRDLMSKISKKRDSLTLKTGSDE